MKDSDDEYENWMKELEIERDKWDVKNLPPDQKTDLG